MIRRNLKDEVRVVGIIGSRRRNSRSDLMAVTHKFQELYEDGDWIVSGGCHLGADNFAERIAKEHGIPIIIHYPDWKKYGRSAGFVRNKEIAADADILIACVAKDRKGGTENTISHFLKDEDIKKLYLV